MLDALGALEESDDARVVPFLLGVIGDSELPGLARIEVCEILKERDHGSRDERRSIARALAAVLLDDDHEDVRGYAAGALASFLDESVARDALEKVVLDTTADRGVRHNAVFAVEQGGPTPWSERLLRQLEVDPDLARMARRILGEWDPERGGDGEDEDDDGSDA